MPFTLSHAAAILPLNKRPLVLSALIAGSFSPDIVYFIPGFISAKFSHSLTGLFLYCLPASLLFLFLIFFFMRNIFFHLPPDIHRQNINSFDLIFPYRPKIIWIIVSIFIGSFTHIFWDSFTHKTGLAVTHFPFLTKNIFKIGGQSIYVYKLLQYASTILGGMIVLIGLRNIISGNNSLKQILSYFFKRFSFYIILILLLSLLSGIIFYVKWHKNYGLKSFVVKTVIFSINSLIIYLIATIFLCNILNFFKSQKSNNIAP